MPPSFEEFVEFVRSWAQLSKRKTITAGTTLEEDLGITGDDGVDLLQAVEQKYQLAFESEESSLRETFKLERNEYLFHSESAPTIFNQAIVTIFGGEEARVRAFTVGSLYTAVTALLQRSR